MFVLWKYVYWCFCWPATIFWLKWCLSAVYYFRRYSEKIWYISTTYTLRLFKCFYIQCSQQNPTWLQCTFLGELYNISSLNSKNTYSFVVQWLASNANNFDEVQKWQGSQVNYWHCPWSKLQTYIWELLLKGMFVLAVIRIYHSLNSLYAVDTYLGK